MHFILCFTLNNLVGFVYIYVSSNICFDFSAFCNSDFRSYQIKEYKVIFVWYGESECTLNFVRLGLNLGHVSFEFD